MKIVFSVLPEILLSLGAWLWCGVAAAIFVTILCIIASYNVYKAL